jgi:long-chain acyl-CoA synthetase
MGTRTRPSRTLADLASATAAAYGDAPALRYKQDGEWVDQSFNELDAEVRSLALGLLDLGVRHGDRVCVLADTRVEWTRLALAISAAGGVIVPIYPSNSPDECEWVIANSGARLLIVEGAGQLAKIDEVRERLAALETIISIDATPGVDSNAESLKSRGQDRGAELDACTDGVALEDPAVIIYTSGTTGRPKGCVLTHRNMMSVNDAVAELDFIVDGDSAYLFLPMAHVFAQITQIGAISGGATTIIFGGDTRNIVGELMETKPTYMPSVPRIFEKIFTTVAGQMTAEQLRDAITVGMAARHAEQEGRSLSSEEQGIYDFVDEMLFSKVRAIFGGNMRQAVSGAAPIAPEILELFHASGVPVLEGYGMTETAGVGTVNTLDAYKIGTVGRPMPGVEVKLAGDDEILMRGANIFSGYWQNPEATAETMDDDGWLHTGDLGSIDDDGFVRITGRKKDIIITAGGKNLTPANLENDLKTSRWISQVVMYGDRRPYPVALITLDMEEIVPWATEEGLASDAASLASAPQVVQLIQEVLDGVNANYARVEQIKKFLILERDLSVEDGELTPTLKVKRNVINERYAERFDALYNS